MRIVCRPTFTRSLDRRSHHAPPMIRSRIVVCIAKAGMSIAGCVRQNSAKASTSTSSVSRRFVIWLMCLSRLTAVVFFE